MPKLPTTPPDPRERKPRLPAKFDQLAPGGSLDTRDPMQAACMISAGRYRGWRMVRRSSGGITRVWRIS